MRRRKRGIRWLIGLLLTLILLTGLIGQAYVLYNQRAEHAELARAGEIRLGRLDVDVAPETLLPRTTRDDNAAPHYASALNAYNARRRLPRDASAAVIEEPPISDAELREIVLGSRCRTCDFYSAGHPLRFVKSDGQPWPFVVASDPYDTRPYIPAIRMLSEVALREGQRLERKGSLKWAEAVYLAAMRMACHLRQNPGSMMDVQLGLELERRAAHYLDVFYRLTGNRDRLARCWKYGDALLRCTAEVQRKYAQLGYFEAAREIALHDRDRIWRIEAIAAVKTAEVDPTVDWWHKRRARALFESLVGDTVPEVAIAAQRALSLTGDQGVEERHEPLGSKHKEAPTQL